MQIIYYFFSIFVMIPIVYAQMFTISGKVFTSTESVKYVSVTFTDQSDSSKKFTTITDTAGNYNLNLLTSVNTGWNLPTKFELAQNYPNPFSSKTSIQYMLKKQSKITVKIYNILGQVVKEFTPGTQMAGTHGIIWDGVNKFGNKATPGIYLYQLQTESGIDTKKMVLLGSVISINQQKMKLVKSFSKRASYQEIKQLASGTYTVKIANQDNTIPRISFSEFTDVTIQNDTTLNFHVEKAEKWKFLGLEKEKVESIAIDPMDSDIIYVGTSSDFSAGIDGKLFKSIDGGVTWDTLLVGGNYLNILIDPLNNNIVYTTPSILIKSEDSGATWIPMSNGIYLDSETFIQSLEMNSQNSSVLYIGTSGFFTGDLYKSHDGGLHWDEMPTWLTENGVKDIAIDPVDTNNIYVGEAKTGTLWKSSDAGQNWIETNLKDTGNLHDIFICPDNTSTIYVGTRGIYKTEDAGNNWVSITDGIPASVFDVIKIQESSFNRLFIVATFGDDGGIYEYSFLHNQWYRMGIDNLHVSYYYTDLKAYINPNRLYFGGNGLYLVNLEK